MNDLELAQLPSLAAQDWVSGQVSSGLYQMT